MKINVQFEAQLREVAGTGRIEMNLPDQASLLDGLKKVANDSERALAERLLTKDSTIQPGVMTFVNDQPVLGSLADSHQLSEGDTILLLPPISGG